MTAPDDKALAIGHCTRDIGAAAKLNGEQQIGGIGQLVGHIDD